MDQSKAASLQTLIGAITKEYGDVILDRTKVQSCEVISTGSLAIDIATGIGGIPLGRITEISGKESSGKSTLCLQLIASAQAKGRLVAYFDTEYAMDPGYAKNLGVSMDDLVISQPDTAEEVLGVTQQLINSGMFDLIVVDSVAAMLPKAVLEGNMEDKHMGVMARLMSQSLPKLIKGLAQNNTALIFVNQMRSTMGSTPYAPQFTTTGGNALKYYCSLRLETAKSTKSKDGDLVIGNDVKVKVTKNKLAPPFTEADTEIRFGEGFNLNGEIIDIGVKLKLIEKSGSWFSYQGERIGQGRESVSQFLNANGAVLNDLNTKIRAMHNIP